MLRFEAASIRYGNRTAVDGVSATAASGRIVALLGPNAAGKSTMLRAAIGNVPLHAGRVCVNGLSVHTMHAGHLARRVSYVPARPSTTASYTAREVIDLGRFRQRPDPRRVESVINEFELHDVANRPVPHLSTGQQQRVAVARALAQLDEPGVLLLDEPTSAMDIRHRQLVYRALRQRALDGFAVLMTIHTFADAVLYADDAWLLDGGRLVATGEAASVLQPDRLESVFRVGFRLIQIDQNLAVPVEIDTVIRKSIE